MPVSVGISASCLDGTHRVDGDMRTLSCLDGGAEGDWRDGGQKRERERERDIASGGSEMEVTSGEGGRNVDLVGLEINNQRSNRESHECAARSIT